MKVQGTADLKIIHGILLSIKETEVAIRLTREAYQTKTHILLMIPGFISPVIRVYLQLILSCIPHPCLLLVLCLPVTYSVSLFSPMSSPLEDWFLKDSLLFLSSMYFNTQFQIRSLYSWLLCPQILLSPLQFQ